MNRRCATIFLLGVDFCKIDFHHHRRRRKFWVNISIKKIKFESKIGNFSGRIRANALNTKNWIDEGAQQFLNFQLSFCISRPNFFFYFHQNKTHIQTILLPEANNNPPAELIEPPNWRIFFPSLKKPLEKGFVHKFSTPSPTISLSLS